MVVWIFGKKKLKFRRTRMLFQKVDLSEAMMLAYNPDIENKKTLWVVNRYSIKIELSSMVYKLQGIGVKEKTYDSIVFHNGSICEFILFDDLYCVMNKNEYDEVFYYEYPILSLEKSYHFMHELQRLRTKSGTLFVLEDYMPKLDDKLREDYILVSKCFMQSFIEGCYCSHENPLEWCLGCDGFDECKHVSKNIGVECHNDKNLFHGASSQ
jgi:hypothetical protein